MCVVSRIESIATEPGPWYNTSMNKIRRTEGKHVPTGEKLAVWHCDSCDRDTSTGTWKAHDGEEGCWCYQCSLRGIKSALRSILIDETRYERGATEVLCCGSWLPCGGFTNTCDKCGADYNWNGMRLTSRSQWGEETGETADEILMATV